MYQSDRLATCPEEGFSLEFESCHDSKIVSTENLEIAQDYYQSGRAAFERGQYRESVQNLEKAASLAARGTRLGGEIQIWLVTAYEAAGQQTQAIALCEQLGVHPDLQTRKQSRRLLYILKAPRLQTRPEWLTQIPDLSKIEGSGELSGGGSAPRPRPSQPKPEPEPIDLSQVNTRDNRFVWAALVGVALTIAGLIWLS